jgi:hypothetical protein
MRSIVLVVTAFACPGVLTADERPQKGGKPVNGLVAVAELEEQADGWVEIKLSLKNVSDKAITTGYYSFPCWLDPKVRHVRVEWTGPDGKKRESKHDDFPPANNQPVRKSDFVTIEPGKTLAIRPVVRFHPASLKPEGDEPKDKWRVANAAEAGGHRVMVSFSNTYTKYARGGGGGRPPSDFVEVEGAWTGVVTANELTFKVK